MSEALVEALANVHRDIREGAQTDGAPVGARQSRVSALQKRIQEIDARL